MARIPLHPYDMARNPVYAYLINHYHETQSWDIFKLRRISTREIADRLVELGILVLNRAEVARLCFDVDGNWYHEIFTHLGDEHMSFRELMFSIPGKKNPTKLKNAIALMHDFKQLDYFYDPITALTVVFKEQNKHPSECQFLDSFYQMSDDMEPRLVYRPEPIFT